MGKIYRAVTSPSDVSGELSIEFIPPDGSRVPYPITLLIDGRIVCFNKTACKDLIRALLECL